MAHDYWFPLYAYLRRGGTQPEDARDLTQEFFVRLTERQALEGLVPNEGRFRSFLLTCLKHFVAEARKHAHRATRRPPQGWLSLDEAEAEHRYQTEATDGVSPDLLYEQRCARAVLNQALTRLEAHYQGNGRHKLFTQLVAHLAGDPGAVPHAELAAALGLTDGAVRTEMYRLRQRFRLVFREAVAATVPEAEVELEMRHILHLLCR